MSGYDNLLEEIAKLQARIRELEHQHVNDELAARLLLAEIERLLDTNGCIKALEDRKTK